MLLTAQLHTLKEINKNSLPFQLRNRKG